MIKDIREINFPEYATLDQATASISDMGDRTISAQVKIDGSVVPDFSFDWEVEFKGERYIHPVREPQGLKDNMSRRSKIDLTFHHWAIYEMKREYFMEMASTTAGTAVADKYIASLGLDLGDFVTAFNLVLNHYFGGKIVMKLNPEWQYATEARFMSISYSYIWDVLQQIHEIYGVRWTLKTNAEGVCEILAGYPAEEVSHIFEYGFEGGLLSVQRQVQSTNIRNRLLGRGGEKNLPYRYFKDADPKNPLFKADPDWVPELANIAFTGLRGKTFRDYVKGWKAKRYNGSAMAQPTEAYLAGYNASKFDPIEYVEDKDSIEKYGVLVGALENNEETYPSIQGAPGDVDAIVDAEQVTDDDVDSAVENDSVTTNLESGHQTYRNAPANSVVTIETLTKRYFSVPEGKVGNLSMSLTATGKYSNFGDYEETHPVLKADTVKVTLYDKITGVAVKSSSAPVVDIPAGDYYYMVSADVETNYDDITMVTLNIESVYLYTSTPNKSEGWKQTFDIWVRNIWGSSRNAGETDQQYADRVWAPILGDRMGGEARVVFATGWLSFSSDWEFSIVGYAFDSSKSGAEWRLTLAKSEAELEASGKYIPYEGYNASAGDKFFFIGVDMPYEYVTWAEERLDDYKRDALLQTANINPTWVIKTDKVRLNQERINEKNEKIKLIDSLNVGSQIRLASKQFIADAYETLYVQSMTYSWQADTLLHPDIEIVVSDKVASVKNPVAQIQSNIESIQRQVGSLSNIQQIIRQVCDKLYLRKDGFSDISKSPTRFLGKISGENFRPGQIGGRDWGIYRDENGNAILEADKFVARQGILVNDLIVSEATYVGGLQINSAASMNITVVEETEDGYVCFFDQKQGTVTNKFVVDDVALCQRFDADQTVVKFYKARVTAVSEDSVTLSKTEVNGSGIPAVDDAIIQYGNYSDKTRQYVIVKDVIGGGYERMLMGLDSVESDGVEYFFAGKASDSKARWFVGDAKQYAKYEDGQLTIKGNLFVTDGDKPIGEQIKYITEALGSSDQGLILGSAIIVGYKDENENFVPMAGLSGVYNRDSGNGGPAAWYGGTPEDAKSVIFMNGTGYFAGGNIRWDEEGGAEFGGGDFKIMPDGSIVFGKDIKISAEGDETLGSILTALAKLSDMFYKTEDGKSIGTKYNLFSEGEMSANGLNLGGGTSGGGGLIQNVLGKSSFGTVVSEDNATTFNAYAIDSLYKRIVELEGKDVEVDLSDYYTKQQTQNAITDALSPYIKATDADGKYAALASFNALQSSFDRLYSALNDDTSGVINTWNEVVDFVNEYSGSEDLSTILGKMNTDINARVKVSDFESWKTDVFNPLSVTVTNLGKKVDTNAANINKLLGWFNVDADGNLFTTYNFYSTKEISANGISQGTGGGGSGLISSVLGVGSLGATLTNDNSVVFNAYATNEIYKATQGHASRIGVLESQVGQLTTQSTKVSVSDLLTTGTKIATITVDGVPHEVKGDFLPTSGGVISGASAELLRIIRTDGNPYVTFISGSNFLGRLGFNTNGEPIAIVNTQLTTLLHSGNYSQYALPLTGGTITTSLYKGGLTLKRSTNAGVMMDFANTLGVLGSIGFYQSGAKIEIDSNVFDILHSGNYSQYAPVINTNIIPATTNLNAVGYGFASNGWNTNGPAIAVGNTNGYTFLLQQEFNSYKTYISFKSTDNVVRPWKQIAFTSDLDNYLPKSGGTIASGAYTPLIIKRNTDNGLAISFQNNLGFLGEIGVNANGSAVFVDATATHTLLHSSNVGDYAIKRSRNISLENDINIAGYGSTNGGWTLNGAALILGYDKDYKFFLQADFTSNSHFIKTRYYGAGAWRGDWKTIAFTDSTVEAARRLVTKDNQDMVHLTTGALFVGRESFNLTHILGDTVTLRSGANATIGLRLNSSGNVTIGAQDLAGTDYRLRVQGGTRLDYNATLAGSFTILNYQDNSFYGIIESGTTGLSVVSIREGVGYTPILLNPNGGNVLIGTTTDSGEKLQVKGLMKATSVATESVELYHATPFIDFHFNNSTVDYTSRIIESSSGVLNINAALYALFKGNVGVGTNNPAYTLDVNGTLRATNAVTFDSTLTIAGATTHNGIAYFGGATYYINTSGNANFNAISGSSLQVDSLSNGGLLETSTLRVSSTSTFTGKTNHNGGIGATSLNVSGTSTLSGHVGIGASSHDDYSLYISGPSYMTGDLTVNGTLYADDIEGSNIYVKTSYNLYLHANGYVGTYNGRWAIDSYGNYKGQSLYINPRDNDNVTNPYDKNKGFPDEEVAVFVNGDIAATGEISADAISLSSDIRFKHQLGDITLDLDTIANAPMFRFTWTNKENSRVQIGTSAQYWKDSARELVSVDKDDFHRLDYATLGVLIGVTLGKTVKNHEDRIKELEREVVELKAENRRLRYEC